MADIKVRTREELLIPDYNYYIFFKIEPGEKDVAKIEKCILQERNKWTQGLPIQRRYKELLSDVENVMINNVGYDCVANGYTINNARELELENAKKIEIGRAIKLIRIMSKRGVLFKSELVKMVFSQKIQWFTVFDLEREIKPLIEQGVWYIDDTQTVIDFRNYKRVDDFLPVTQSASIYEILGLDSSAPISSFAPAIKAANSQNNAIATTPKGTAIGKILGIAQTIIFKSDETKKKYDDYLAIKKEVWDELELRQSLGIHEIDISEFLDYAQIKLYP